MTEKESFSPNCSEDKTEQTDNHSTPSSIPSRQVPEREEKTNWAVKDSLEKGLTHAGVALWRWDLMTDDLLIFSAFEESKDQSSFPRLTTWERLVHEEDRDRLFESLHTFESTRFLAFDCFFRLSADEPRWIHARDMGVQTAELGEPMAVTGLFFDATEGELARRKLMWGQEFEHRGSENPIAVVRRIAERLRHENDGGRVSDLMDQCYHQFISLFSFSNLPAFRKNTDLVTIDVNPAMAKLLGMTVTEIINRSDRDIWGPGLAGRLLKHCAAALSGETVLVNTRREIGGEEIEFMDQFFPDWGPNHRIKGVYGILAPWSTDTVLSGDGLELRERTSSAMQDVYLKAQLAAQHDCIVLLTGESGTGKDYLAKHIHDLSKRSSGPFENFNCAALQRELAGSELFGHEAGAFTGAKAMRRGIFELANEGTVFLNEIGDMPLDLQPTLLTILETRSFRRVGGEKEVTLGARIIAATNVDLMKEVESRQFRKDLYHRLTVFSIRVPPLRERLDELPDLIENLIEKVASDLGHVVPALDPLVLHKLRDYSWPGNIRELRNVLERAFIHSQGPLIRPEHIVFESEDAVTAAVQPSRAIRPEGYNALSQSEQKRKTGDLAQKPSEHQLRQLYQQFIVEKGWTRAGLADRMGVHSSTLKKWFKAAGLEAGKRGRPRKVS